MWEFAKREYYKRSIHNMLSEAPDHVRLTDRNKNLIFSDDGDLSSQNSAIVKLKEARLICQESVDFVFENVNSNWEYVADALVNLCDERSDKLISKDDFGKKKKILTVLKNANLLNEENEKFVFGRSLSSSAAIAGILVCLCEAGLLTPRYKEIVIRDGTFWPHHKPWGKKVALDTLKDNGTAKYTKLSCTSNGVPRKTDTYPLTTLTIILLLLNCKQASITPITQPKNNDISVYWRLTPTPCTIYSIFSSVIRPSQPLFL